MPFVHMYYCANPILCSSSDKAYRMYKEERNNNAKYYMASYYGSKTNINNKQMGW